MIKRKEKHNRDNNNNSERSKERRKVGMDVNENVVQLVFLGLKFIGQEGLVVTINYYWLRTKCLSLAYYPNL